MKRKGKIKIVSAIVLWLSVLAMLFTTSCTEEEPKKAAGDDPAALEVSVNFSIKGQKAVKSIDKSDEINDVNLFVCDDKGALAFSCWTKTGSIMIPLQKNRLYRFYAIANIGYEMKPQNESDIRQYRYALMSGKQLADCSNLPLCCHLGQLMFDGIGSTSVNMELVRCVAKVVLSGRWQQLNPDVHITINRVALRNVPKSMSLFEPSTVTSRDQLFSDDEFVYEKSDNVDLFSGDSVEFFILENIQGELPSEPNKTLPEGSEKAGLCSYIEIAADYVSPRHKGEFAYRFYLGREDMVSTYDVERNTIQNIAVCFTGEGSPEESSWRVNSKNLETYVTSISVSADTLLFLNPDETRKIDATAFPENADNRGIKWSSSNPQVASVDNQGNVTSHTGRGACVITAEAADGSGIKSEVYVLITQPRLFNIEINDGAGIQLRCGFYYTVPYKFCGDETPKRLKMKVEYVGEAFGEYFDCPDPSKPTTIIGLKKTPVGVSGAVRISFVDFPEAVFEAPITVIEPITFNAQSEIKLLANAAFTRKHRLSYEDISCSYTLIWATNKDAREVSFSIQGMIGHSTMNSSSVLLYPIDGENGNGTGSVKFLIRRDIDYYNERIPISVWEEVNLIGVTECIRDSDNTIKVKSSYSLYEPKPVNLSGKCLSDKLEIIDAQLPTREEMIALMGDGDYYVVYTPLKFKTHFVKDSRYYYYISNTLGLSNGTERYSGDELTVLKAE